MREFMMQHRLQYRNYSMKTYANYPNHSFPYVETPKVYYNSMGDYLLRGYDVWEWNERRGTGGAGTTGGAAGCRSVGHRGRQRGGA